MRGQRAGQDRLPGDGKAGGADSIDDMDLLRHGAMPGLFGGIRAPSTLGSHLRAYAWGNVRKLEKAPVFRRRPEQPPQAEFLRHGVRGGHVPVRHGPFHVKDRFRLDQGGT